jgi:hypothetical protein
MGATGRANTLDTTFGRGSNSHGGSGSPAMILAACTPAVPMVFPTNRSKTNPVHNLTTRPVVTSNAMDTASGGPMRVLPVGAKTPLRSRNSPRMVPVTRHVQRTVRVPVLRVVSLSFVLLLIFGRTSLKSCARQFQSGKAPRRLKKRPAAK